MVMDKIYQNNLNKLTDAVMDALKVYIEANKAGFDQMYKDLLHQTKDEAKAQQQLREYFINFFVITLTYELKGVI